MTAPPTAATSDWAAEEPGDELRDAEGGERRDGAGDRGAPTRRPARAGRGHGDIVHPDGDDCMTAVHPVAPSSEPGAEPAVRALDADRQAERLADARVRSASRRSGRPRPTRPRQSTSACPKPAGISSTWWVTRTTARGVGAAARPAEVADERLAGAEIEARAGLVEDQQVGVRHQGPGDLDPPPLAGRELAERVRPARSPTPIAASRSRARARSASVIRVPPRTEGRMARGHDDVERGQTRVDRGLEARTRVADPAPQLAGVDPADRLAEDLDGAARRPEVRAGDVDERRLARAVRPDDDPPLARRRPTSRSARGASGRLVRTETPDRRRIIAAILPAGRLPELVPARLPLASAAAPRASASRWRGERRSRLVDRRDREPDARRRAGAGRGADGRP